MRYIVSAIIAVLVCFNLTAQTPKQETAQQTVQLDSLSSHFLMRISQHTAPYYKLYKTNNMWTFLELETFSGKIWQVQYSIEGGQYRFKTALNTIDLTYGGTEETLYAGRFELYPTENMYNFILLDTFNGRTWQVQWSTKEDNRGVWGIY